jgi:hypothetical protein
MEKESEKAFQVSTPANQAALICVPSWFPRVQDSLTWGRPYLKELEENSNARNARKSYSPRCALNIFEKFFTSNP